MANIGPVAIQGCAIRISRLAADGSIAPGSTSGMIVNDRPFLKFTAKPNTQAGVEMNPLSACGSLLISYKDYDRIKRWDATLDFGDYDFDRMEMMMGSTLITAPTSAGRTFADGVTVSGSTHITSPALAVFTTHDVNRTITGTGIPAGSVITHWVSATEVVISSPATAGASGLSIVLGALAASRTIGVSWPQLLVPSNTNGVAIEIWQKAIQPGTGYQGTTPYPSAGAAASGATPALPSSAYIRFGAFRFIPVPADVGIEDKESSNMFTGWCLENPLFGLGPALDWTTEATMGSGTAVDTTKVFNAMMDFQLPAVLHAGYQTTS